VTGDPVAPSTEEVRWAYQHGAVQPSITGYRVQDLLGQDFDAWLLEVRRAAWDQGYGTGVIDQSRWEKDGIPDGGVRNPYGGQHDGTTAG
jgi:hypothetical protein